MQTHERTMPACLGRAFDEYVDLQSLPIAAVENPEV